MPDRIRRISESFTEEEFEKLKELKEDLDVSWHDFIIELVEEHEGR